jgi:hypothetical protein
MFFVFKWAHACRGSSHTGRESGVPHPQQNACKITSKFVIHRYNGVFLGFYLYSVCTVRKKHWYVPVSSDVSADESEVSESVLRAFHPAGFLCDHACNSAPQFVPAQSVPIWIPYVPFWCCSCSICPHLNYVCTILMLFLLNLSSSDLIPIHYVQSWSGPCSICPLLSECPFLSSCPTCENLVWSKGKP